MEQIVEVGNGSRLCVESFGDPANPLALQIEGHLAQLIATPASYCEQLADRGWHVVRFDNRDVGRSQRFPRVRYTLADLVDDTHHLIATYGVPAVVCGRSMGGMVAQLLALAYPDDVAGLGLFFTRPRPAAGLPRTPRQVERAAAAAYPTFTSEAQFVAWEQQTLPGIAGPAYPFTRAYIDELATTMWRRGVDSGGYARQAAAMVLTPDWSDRLHEIAVPTAIVHGEQDPIVPVHCAQELHDLIAGSSLHIVPGLGHQQPPELDAVFVEVADRLGH